MTLLYERMSLCFFICHVLRSNTHPWGQSLTAGAEWPEHRVAQTLQNLLQHLQRTGEQRVRAEKCFDWTEIERRATDTFKEQNKNERTGLFFFFCFVFQKRSISPVVDTSCGAAAVQLLSSSRRGDRSSNTFHWQRSWQLVTREEKVASVNSGVNKRLLQATVARTYLWKALIFFSVAKISPVCSSSAE